MEQQLNIPGQKDLDSSILNAKFILDKTYLSSLNNFEVQSNYTWTNDKKQALYLNDFVRLFDISQIVIGKNENFRDKLISVYNAVEGTGASLILYIKGTESKTSFYMGVKQQGKDVETNNITLAQGVLKSNLSGNFPGIVFNNLQAEDIQKEILSDLSKNASVSSVTDIAGLRSKEETETRRYIQGLEKLIDTMQGECYSLLLIADPISSNHLETSRLALENLYSELLPFCNSEYTLSESEAIALTESLSQGATQAINKSITDSISHTDGSSATETNGTSNSFSFNGSTIGAGIGALVGNVPGAIVGAIGASLSYSHTTDHSIATATNVSKSESRSKQSGYSDSFSRTESKGLSDTKTSGRSIQIKFENHTIKQILARIDDTLKRYKICGDLGMWNCAVYGISPKPDIAQMTATSYQALIRGNNSSLESGAVTSWSTQTGNGTSQAQKVLSALRNMEHPQIKMGQNNISVTPGTLVSTAELAIQAGLPNHSVPGISVLECADFGRMTATYNKAEDQSLINLGNIYHMHHEEKLAVFLDCNSLASHTFITGSTGSGKSNTIYQILAEAQKKGVPFLVIEPAKGEYKNIFGQRDDVAVYGTNPDIAPLLKLNPFAFPPQIHVLEHLDRLTEIFNVCWPMYAAMPAVLKEAIGKAYEEAGWNLTESTNAYGSGLYPTFTDVTKNIRSIIDSSEYDSENKGAYKGSLVTRLKSLSNGINGLLFATDEISSSTLFDKNTIIDLSRVGSAETKALIMGLLVLKLQEYRMTSGKMNVNLQHLTVLEEAHNLLKRTSTEQISESGNLQGKSVEMLTNAIAEMRTYGEGFIIADQAPALLDLAVIRNTNTKIIMRLPDFNDRDLVGKAANLTADQITELAKLPCGVGAIYQNEWIQPVLCKVFRVKTPATFFVYQKPAGQAKHKSFKIQLKIASLLSRGLTLKTEKEISEIRETIFSLGLRATTAVQILQELQAPQQEPKMTALAPIMSELFPEALNAIKVSYKQTSDVKCWTKNVDSAIQDATQQVIDDQVLRDIRQGVITEYIFNELGNIKLLEQWATEGGIA